MLARSTPQERRAPLRSAPLRKQSAEAFGRVVAPELETLVADAVRRHVQANTTDPYPILETDRELIERHPRRWA